MLLSVMRKEMELTKKQTIEPAHELTSERIKRKVLKWEDLNDYDFKQQLQLQGEERTWHSYTVA
jgi:hypothetical protein